MVALRTKKLMGTTFPMWRIGEKIVLLEENRDNLEKNDLEAIRHLSENIEDLSE